MNRKNIARFLVGSCAALLAVAVSAPARAQVYDRDGRYVETEPAPSDEYEVQAPAEGEPVPQEVQPYDAGEAGDYGPADQQAYLDESSNPEGYVVADDCVGGCDVTTWSAPYIEPWVGTTIVFGAPVFRLGHWYRPYFHRPYYRSSYGYSRPYHGSRYRSYGYGGGWRRGYSQRSYVAPRTYSGSRTHSYSTPRASSGGRSWSGSRTYSGGHSYGGHGGRSRR